MGTEQPTNGFLEKISEKESLAQKKLQIYARLLINPALAQAMEKIAKEHAKRLEILCREQGEEPKKKEGGERA